MRPIHTDRIPLQMRTFVRLGVDDEKKHRHLWLL